MVPEQIVLVHNMQDARAAVQQYLTDNIGYQAEDRDLVWSWRYLVAKLSLMGGQKLPFADLVAAVSTTISETNSEKVKFLTAELIAKKMCTAVPGEFVAAPVAETPPAS
jgi:hypothetical protein